MQTPIEWLLTHLTAEGYINETKLINRDTSLNELCRTALEFEKIQIKSAYDRAINNMLSSENDEIKTSQQYYDETFNKQ